LLLLLLLQLLLLLLLVLLLVQVRHAALRGMLLQLLHELAGHRKAGWTCGAFTRKLLHLLQVLSHPLRCHGVHLHHRLHRILLM